MDLYRVFGVIPLNATMDCCFIKNAKLYSITSEKKQQDHISKYPHLTPDLIHRHCKQSEKSDMYSVGKIIIIIN